MEKTKDKMNEKLNEEPVVSKQFKEDVTMKKNRRFVAMLASIIMMLTLAGCNSSAGGETNPPVANPTVETTVAVAPTEVEVPTATEAVAEPTKEADPTPTEAVVNDNPYVIDGIDFTNFGKGQTIVVSMAEMKYDEPKIIATRSVRLMSSMQRDVVCFLSDGDQFTEEKPEEIPDDYQKTYFTYYIYAPKEIKDVVFNEESVEVDLTGDGDIMIADHVNKEVGDSMEIDGVTYPKVFYFNMESKGIFNDDEVAMTIEYEDGTSDTVSVFITKEFVDY